ncbi:MAG: response regulator [Candidatus Omnitrophica bacterium]|nr:response regulator [Candidatus Omnitrophota bacterium]
MSEPVRVLLVEDSGMDVEIVTRILAKNPYLECVVEVARSGEDALEKVKKTGFNVILCDFNMPGMNGLETLKKFHENQIGVPVIMVTGQRDQRIAAELMKEGAYDYVSKEEGYSVALPFVIQEALSKFQAKQEKERLEREILQKNAELEKVNEDLSRLNQMKSNFVSTASHELRTPLSIIRETTSLILEEEIGPLNDKQKMFLNNVKNQSDRLLRTVTDLLDLTKIEAGKLELHKSFVNLSDWINRIIDFFQIHAREKKIHLSAEIPPGLGETYMDEDKMIQVLTNLLGNAMKFTAEEGRISVVALDKQESVEIRVTDTGIGIPPQDIGKIFDRFQQAEHQESVYLQKGTGLGLAITKEIVTLHQGKVGVESQPGAGSTFWFTLPRLNHDQVALEILGKEIARSKEHQQVMTLCLIQFAVQKNAIPSSAILEELKLRLGLVIRKGRDQFFQYKDFIGVLMKETDVAGAKAALERVTTLLKDCAKSSGRFQGVTFSTAIATYPHQGDQSEELLDFCLRNFHPVIVSG